MWSPGIPPNADLRGLPVVPCTQNGAGRPVRQVDAPLAWAWTTPGDDRALRTYGDRLVADIELAGWDGSPDEADDAAALAATCPAVTSHGYVKRALRSHLAAFAELGKVAMPQVYDADGSTGRTRGGAALFLRRCVASHHALGFERVVPILGTKAGLPCLRAWRAACDDLGLVFHLWAYGQIVADPAVARWVAEVAEEQVARFAAGSVVAAPLPPPGGPSPEVA